MKLSRKTLLTIACVVIVVAGGFYYFFFFAVNPSDSVISTGAPASAAEVSFISLVGKLEPITFDTSMLADPRFTSLVDIRTNVVSEPQGRTDPFAPLGR